MPEVLLDNFEGIDLVQGRIRKSPRSCRVARNKYLTSGRTWKTRFGVQKVAELIDQSVGLFKANGLLYSLVPAGTKAYKQYEPQNVRYMPIGTSTTEDMPDRVVDSFGNVTQGIKRLHNYVTFGTDDVNGQIPYVVIEMASGQIFHHYADQELETIASRISTVVDVPYIMEPGLVNINDKLYAPSRAGEIHYCKTLLPHEWDEKDNPLIEDAGRLSVAQNSESERIVTGISYHNNNLLVFFKNSVQVWSVSPDPSQNQLIQPIPGTGTESINTVAPVINDVIYFSDGGFRNLRRASVNQELIGEQVGTPIDPLTSGENITNENAHIVWYQKLGLYICFVNQGNGTSRAYILTWIPSKNIQEWAYWDLQHEVDYILELDGTIYFREGNTVYSFVDTCDEDEGNPIEWELEFNKIGTNNIGSSKKWLTFDCIQTGKSTVSLLYDGLQEEPETLCDIENDTIDDGIIPIGERSQTLGVVLTGSGAHELESIEINYKQSKQRAR